MQTTKSGFREIVNGAVIEVSWKVETKMLKNRYTKRSALTVMMVGWELEVNGELDARTFKTKKAARAAGIAKVGV